MDYKDLTVFKKAFELAMLIFEESKKFPKEKMYSLTDQIRRSSRSVCSNIAEGYRKRQYPAHFSSKMSDANMENSETQTWLLFASACLYISTETMDNLQKRSEEVGRLLSHMVNNPESYNPSSKK
ncbi:S23 ribosomal protein [Bacteroidetes bacterium UKL13-3]|nr:S23 ribosomal protein [Bacteroidetes bacterium UKL13-3]HCP92449.1 diversity-generating retroelement protein bAvd family protein [Bacteroidota bacterium]